MNRLLLAVLLLANTAWAGPLDDANNAIKIGDYATAVNIYRKLAGKNDANAEFRLGSLYYEGKGIPQDEAEAIRWYRLAAIHGNATAQYIVGMTEYGEARNNTKQYVEAFKWFRLAAAQGDRESQYKMGWMYYFGEGVTQDYVRAHMWINISAAAGKTDAVKDRNAVSEKLTQQQISEAQKMARECQARKFKGCD